MQAGWLKPVDITGLTWTEPEELGGRQLASVEQVKTTKALLDIVRGADHLHCDSVVPARSDHCSNSAHKQSAAYRTIHGRNARLGSAPETLPSQQICCVTAELMKHVSRCRIIAIVSVLA